MAVVARSGAYRFVGAGIAAIVHDGAGQLCAWGRNATKLVTDSDTEGVYRQPQCRAVIDVSELVVGDTHACLRHAAGSFTCWGERYYGQLGIGGAETADVGPPGSPVSLPAAAVALSAGVSHTCALVHGGEIFCFGRNSLGQVGPAPGTAEEEVRSPAKVSGFPGPVIALGGGSSAHHTCAILTDGSVMCWGNNAEGQLGNGVPAREPGRFSAEPVSVAF